MNKRQRKKHVRKFFKRNLLKFFLELVPENKPRVVIEENNELFLRLVPLESATQMVKNIEKNAIRYKGGEEAFLQTLKELKETYGEKVFDKALLATEKTLGSLTDFTQNLKQDCN